MNISEYRDKVIALFRHGQPTDEQWEEMANVVLYASEIGNTPTIDETIDPYIAEQEDRP